MADVAVEQIAGRSTRRKKGSRDLDAPMTSPLALVMSMQEAAKKAAACKKLEDAVAVREQHSQLGSPRSPRTPRDRWKEAALLSPRAKMQVAPHQGLAPIQQAAQQIQPRQTTALRPSAAGTSLQRSNGVAAASAVVTERLEPSMFGRLDTRGRCSSKELPPLTSEKQDVDSNGSSGKAGTDAPSVDNPSTEAASAAGKALLEVLDREHVDGLAHQRSGLWLGHRTRLLLQQAVLVACCWNCLVFPAQLAFGEPIGFSNQPSWAAWYTLLDTILWVDVLRIG